MFEQSIALSWFELFLVGIAAYLLVFGVVQSFSRLRQTFLFIVASICLALVLLDEPFDLPPLLFELAQLCLWPLLYLFIRYHDRAAVFHGSYGLLLLVPAGWAITLLSGLSVRPFFGTIYFVEHIGLLLLAAMHVFSRPSHHPAFRRWLLSGVIVLLTCRLLSPIFIADAAIYLGVFHILTAFFFIGMTYFLMHAVSEPLVSTLEQETGLNYEEELARRLERVLKHEKVYLTPELTLQELSAKMQIRSQELSAFFNHTLGKSFNDVVNEYRIDEVKRLMLDPATDRKATIMELAYQSGFNSKATFNRIFKQVTGITPKEFKQASTTT